MPRGVTNDELWESVKGTFGCSSGCLTAFIILLLLVGFILLCLGF